MESENKKRGRWEKGESGNPKGRPQGTGEVAQLRQSIAAHVPEIISCLVDKAKDGDVQAARLLLERVLPPVKPIEQPVALPLPSDDDLTGKGLAIVQAVAEGTLAPSQGSSLLMGLNALARIRLVDELAERIELLELTIKERNAT